MFIGYRYYDKKQMAVNFPFGHGLSYTRFAYSDLKLSAEHMTDADTLTVRCKVLNIGAVPGKEIVQLYVGEQNSKVRRPVRELKGFAKVSLAPGEETEVTFVLDKRSFAYYEPKIHDWYAESGRYEIAVGASSRNLRLTATVEVKATADLPFTYTTSSTVADLQRTAKGRAKFAEIFAMMGGEQGRQQEKQANSALGEGSDRMMDAMFYEMPLSAFHSYGLMTRPQLLAWIDDLNRD